MFECFVSMKIIRSARGPETIERKILNYGFGESFGEGVCGHVPRGNILVR
jgi:hypothetical protein